MTLDEYSSFEPCLLITFRDPNVFGRPSYEYGVHRWNNQDCPFNMDLAVDVVEYPLPLGVFKEMEKLETDFEKPNEPLFCKDCFGELEKYPHTPQDTFN